MMCEQVGQMNYWRISPYDTELRDSGAECETFVGIQDLIEKRVSDQEYLAYEQSYLKAIDYVVETGGWNVFRLVDYAKYDDEEYPFPDGIVAAPDFVDGQEIDTKKMYLVAKLCLRSIVRSKIESSDFYLHFGWDFYMYMACPQKCDPVKEKIRKLGLTVEEGCRSPYENDDE